MLRFFSRFVPLYRVNIDSLRLQTSTPVSYKTYQYGEATGVFCTVPPVSKGTWVRIRGDLVIQSNGYGTVFGGSALQKCLADNWIVPFWQYGKAEVKKLPPVTIASQEAKRAEQNPPDPDEPITWRHWPESIDTPPVGVPTIVIPPTPPLAVKVTTVIPPEPEITMESVLQEMDTRVRKNIRKAAGQMHPHGQSSQMQNMEALVHYEGGPVLGYVYQGATEAEIHDFYSELELILKEKNDKLSRSGVWLTEDEQVANVKEVMVDEVNREEGIMKHPIPTTKPPVPQSSEAKPPLPQRPVPRKSLKKHGGVK